MYRSGHACRRILLIILVLAVLAGSVLLLREYVFPPVPEALIALAEKEPEAAAFVSRYRQLFRQKYNAADIDVSQDISSGDVPLLLQWDERWGCAPYGDSILAISGCGPASLSMVALALTGNTAANPVAVGNYSAEQGWYFPGTGTSWDLMRSGAEHFGLNWQELPLVEDTIRQALWDGKLLILSLLPGDFTMSGHFVVVSGYTDGGYHILDPNSRSRSRVWSFEALSGQIANIWAYSVQ